MSGQSGPRRILIAGLSTRAAATSAADAGFAVTALDAFGDLDRSPGVRAVALPRDVGRPFTARAAASAAASFDCEAVAYVSNFENHPKAVGRLAAGRALWGNPPEVLRRVRDPFVLGDALRRRGFKVPDLVARGIVPAEAGTHGVEAGTHGVAAGTRGVEAGTHSASQGTHEIEPHESEPHGSFRLQPARREQSGRFRLQPERQPEQRFQPEHGWLVKPLASGGGHHVRVWDGKTPLPPRSYVQESIAGVPGSVVFVAAAGRAVPIGFSRQLIGDAAFGASGFRYCGSILAPAGDPQFVDDARLFDEACAAAGAVAEEFHLVGVNGLDFVARHGTPYAIEVNPRWCASMELVERAYGVSVFGAHADACSTGALPDVDLRRTRGRAGAVGKAIVFARADVIVGDTTEWLGDTTVRDIPHPGERIAAGHPICTVFAEARDGAGCHAALVRRAARVYAELTGVGVASGVGI